ncbi:hypothetical protein ACIPYQ_02770 [Streptomyces sp. NPDC090045]|uniref:hypothetical protein n=1 Tax=Streptomyces sp. NPDC090045 TaxID=3365927 RepID=UPI00382E4AD4
MSSSMAGEFGKGFANELGREAASFVAEWAKKPENQKMIKEVAIGAGASLVAVVQTAGAFVATPPGALLVGTVAVAAIGAVIIWTLFS